ncbi:MAG: M20/M25/M40 family metallo-hydrolase [Hellea sp.]|nr:M20/M25/M40 family metallo-hydrolase [Hellea sp.]
MANRLARASAYLSKLVSMDTQNGSGDEIACTQYLAVELKRHNPDQLILDTVTRSRGKFDSGYVYAGWGKADIVLNVHIDTVPSGSGWTANPLILRDDGDRLIGLGSSDIKGAAACILAALEDQTPKNVGILFSGDEEHGSEIMPAIIERKHFGDARMAIICEPTSCQVGRQHRGMLAYGAKFRGKGGHSSLADVTERPLLEAARLGAAIGEYGDRYLDFGELPYKGLCTNIGALTSDGSYNVIPTESEIQFSMRPPPGDSVASRAQDLESIVASVAPAAELSQIVQLEPFKCKDITAFERIFDNSYARVDLPYWTEAALFSQADVNAVVFGPGNLDQAHKPDEYVLKEQLQTAIELYSSVVSGSNSGRQ